MKACANKDCAEYGKAWETFTFCDNCGNKLREIKDHLPLGKIYCVHCGKKHEIEFVEEESVP